MEYRQPEATQSQEMDSGEKRLNELGYKQELRREMVLLISLFFGSSVIVHISFFFLVDKILGSNNLFCFMGLN